MCNFFLDTDRLRLSQFTASSLCKFTFSLLIPKVAHSENEVDYKANFNDVDPPSLLFLQMKTLTGSALASSKKIAKRLNVVPTAATSSPVSNLQRFLAQIALFLLS